MPMPGLGELLLWLAVSALLLLAVGIWLAIVLIRNLVDPDQPRKPVLIAVLLSYAAGLAGHVYLVFSADGRPQLWIFSLMILGTCILSAFATDVKWVALPASFLLAVSWLICLTSLT